MPSQPLNQNDPRDSFFETGHMTDDLTRRTGNASVYMLAFSLIRIVLQFGTIAVISRFIPPAEFAVFALTLPAIMLSMAFANFGLTQVVIQKDVIRHSEVSALFWISTMISLATVVLLCLLSWPMALWLEQPELTAALQVASIAVVFSTMSGQYLAIARRRLEVKRAETVMMCAHVFAAGVAILGAILELSYWALILQQVLIPFVGLIALLFALGWLPSPPPALQTLREHVGALRFGGYVAGSAVLNQLAEYMGTYIVRSVFDAAQTGLYFRARNLASMSSAQVMRPLSAVFVPGLSRLQNDPVNLRAMFSRLLSRANLIVLPIAVLLAVGAEPITLLLLGPDWSDAIPLVQWMSIFTLCAPAAGAFQDILVAQGFGRALFLFGVFRVVALGIGMLIAVPYGLIQLTVAAMLLELLLFLPLLNYLACRLTPLDFGQTLKDCWGDIAFAALAALAIGVSLDSQAARLSLAGHAAAVLAAISVIWGIRILLSQQMRSDVGRLISKVVSFGRG